MAWSDAARRAAAEARRLKELQSADKKARARKFYKPSTGDKQKLAADSERRIATMLKAKPTVNRAAFDTIIKRGQRLHSIEIKTLMDNKNDKITMHKDSLERKLKWAKEHKSIMHTIVLDRRGPKPQMYYRNGVGSFRLSSLLKVTGASHLRRLIA